MYYQYANTNYTPIVCTFTVALTSPESPCVSRYFVCCGQKTNSAGDGDGESNSKVTTTGTFYSVTILTVSGMANFGLLILVSTFLTTRKQQDRVDVVRMYDYLRIWDYQ